MLLDQCYAAACLLFISDASFKALFRAVDGDCDGSIQFNDFEAIVFPDTRQSQREHMLQEEQAAIAQHSSHSHAHSVST